MKIGIIGKGNVAQALTAALTPKHDIRFGVRQPVAEAHGSLPNVATWAEAIILTTPWRAEATVAAEIADHVRGKPVIDATNPVAMAEHGPTIAQDGSCPSAAERLQSRLPGALVIKAFNQIGAEYMAEPTVLKKQPVMFAAGDDEAARKRVLTLIEDAGFEAVDCGPLANARHLESLAMIWIWQAVKGPLGRRFGFSLTHRVTDGPD